MRFVKGPALVAGISLVVLTLAACGDETSEIDLLTALPAQPTESPLVAATATALPSTSIPATSTGVPTATATSVPPSSTPIATSVPPSSTPVVTSVPPSSTPILPSATVVPPSATAVPPTSTSTPEPQVLDVSSDIIRFVLEDLEVAVGATVTWTNQDAAPHTTSSGKPPNRTTDVWRSDTLNKGDSHSFTFDTPGEYPYFCEIHPGMTAVVKVSDGA